MMININKRLIIILSASIIVVIIIIVGILYFVNQSNTKKSVVTDTTDNNSEYVVEPGLEEMAKIVKPAVESYATQDITESKTARNARLNTYFASGSPVYDLDIDIRSTNTATKTTAKVVSIKSSNFAGEDMQLLVKANVVYHLNDSTRSTTQTYWITLIQNNSGVYMPYAIGLLQE